MPVRNSGLHTIIPLPMNISCAQALAYLLRGRVQERSVYDIYCLLHDIETARERSSSKARSLAKYAQGPPRRGPCFTFGRADWGGLATVRTRVDRASPRRLHAGAQDERSP